MHFVSDENGELKSQYSELSRRFHEMEIEYRRLENEREELAAAYKESEAVRIIRKINQRHTLPNNDLLFSDNGVVP